MTALVFAVFTKTRHGILLVLLGGVIVYASVNLGNWYGTYLVRLLAFLVTGYGLKLLVRSWLEYLRRYSLLLLVFAVAMLVFHVCMRGLIHGFYRDWIAVGPVLIAFATLDFKSLKIKRFVGLFGVASMGVYLIHPLFTRAISVVITRCVIPPYSVFVVFAEWGLAWLLALVATLIIRRVPIVKMVV